MSSAKVTRRPRTFIRLEPLVVVSAQAHDEQIGLPNLFYIDWASLEGLSQSASFGSSPSLAGCGVIFSREKMKGRGHRERAA